MNEETDLANKNPTADLENEVEQNNTQFEALERDFQEVLEMFRYVNRMVN